MLSDAEGFLKLLKDGGPWAIVVILGYALVAVYRSKESQAKAAYDQIVQIVTGQTAAAVKLEEAVRALRDAIDSIERRMK